MADRRLAVNAAAMAAVTIWRVGKTAWSFTVYSFIHLLALSSKHCTVHPRTFFSCEIWHFSLETLPGLGSGYNPLSARGGNRTKKMCQYYLSLLQAFNVLREESCQNRKIRKMRPKVKRATYAPWWGQGAALPGGGQGFLSP